MSSEVQIVAKRRRYRSAPKLKSLHSGCRCSGLSSSRFLHLFLSGVPRECIPTTTREQLRLGQRDRYKPVGLMENSIFSAELEEGQEKKLFNADETRDLMANKAIRSTSGSQLRSEEETESLQEVKETFTTSSSNFTLETQSLSRFRSINAWELDDSVYIGEGNATLVISIPYQRKVIRFRKSGQNSAEEPAEDGGKKRAEFLVDFFKYVISGLMGRYANEPEIVRCNPENVKLWMSLLDPQRPENRRHKKVMDSYATILPDYTLLPGYLHDKLPSSEKKPTFCVEIKPKQGFIEKKIALFSNKCDYCRKQYSKLAEGKITALSRYCPCDLFSGESDRMRQAVKGLADSPQNNFRIFKNGRLVWGENFEPDQLDFALTEWFFPDKSFEKEEALEAMFQLIYEALLRPFSQNKQNSASIVNGSSNNEAAGRSLPENSVLDTILRVQRLNNRSIDFVYDIYSKYSRILNDEMIYLENNAKLIGDENLHESEIIPSDEELSILRKYLLFRLAKDCSILMAFQEIDSSTIPIVPSDNVIQISESRCFLFNTAVTDLDPKSVHSISKHYRQFTEITKFQKEGQGAWS